MEEKIIVKVKANASKNESLERKKGFLKVSIKSKPIQGKANSELVKFLEKELECKARIIRGFNCSDKQVILQEKE
jgi:uncharacterized protein (TIGR00251 family)